MDRPLRLITASPVDRLALTLEALLVVASQPLSVEDLAVAADDDVERIETALRLLAERFAEGRSGIVLEHVAGGWAFRASREAAEACGRLFERPVERGLSAAGLETLAIVAYLGPVSRPEIARIRGVAADSVVRVGGAGPDCRGWPRGGRRWGRALPGDTALRARVRARVALRATAPGRPGREHRRDPHAARVRRRAPPRLREKRTGTHPGTHPGHPGEPIIHRCA